MLNIELMKEWSAALRSGEYKQTKNLLRDRRGFCCLGVLCDLAAKHDVGEWLDSDVFRVTFGDRSDTTLPDSVAGLAGLPPILETRLYGAGEVQPDQWNALAHFNDTGTSFGMIADIIDGWVADAEESLIVAASDGEVEL